MITDDALEVVIPTRNAPDLLWLTLSHLLAFNGKWATRVTLLDNCSTAPGMDLVLAFAARNGCLVVRHEGNVGVWASVNRGLALSRSRWVFVLTADVLLGPRALPALMAAAAQIEVPFLGPQVFTGARAIPVLAAQQPEDLGVNPNTYNGAAFLLDWPTIRDKVGWFDPRFYVCCGDTDFSQRVADAGLRQGVLLGVPCVHLDKGSRRADGTAREDTEVEVRDLAAFREKWAGRDDVLEKHQMPNAEAYVALKERAGWGTDNWKGL